MAVEDGPCGICGGLAESGMRQLDMTVVPDGWRDSLPVEHPIVVGQNQDEIRPSTCDFVVYVG